VSYAALNDRVNRLAHALAARGVVRGDRIAVLSENRIEYVEIELAAAKLGVMVACQNWRLAEHELAHCIALASPRFGFVSERYAAKLARIPHPLSRSVVLGEEYERMLAGSSGAEPPTPQTPRTASSFSILAVLPAFPPMRAPSMPRLCVSVTRAGAKCRLPSSLGATRGSAPTMLAMCRGRIANYKLPKEVRFVAEAELPRSTTGKIKRHELEARLAAEAELAQ
jgi:acyl-CoA synthetase (AMP-forming)/AMP-acid ligase II